MTALLAFVGHREDVWSSMAAHFEGMHLMHTHT